MSNWSVHVKKYAKRHKMSYKEASMDPKCKESYRKKSKKRMNNPEYVDNIRDRIVGGEEIHEVNIPGADFSRQGLDGRDLSRNVYTGANFNRASLFMSDLRGSVLDGTDFTRGALVQADATNVPFREAILEEIDADNARLNMADFTNARLVRGNFTDAELMEANLTGADATGANFTNADLGGADLTRTILTSANFTNAIIPERFREHVLRQDIIGRGTIQWEDEE